MKKIATNIAMLITAILLIRCANVVTPSGGPKDTQQPVVLESTPENNSKNFKGKSIHITFDEFVTLNNPSNNVLISPPMVKKPTYRLSGKTLVIRFEEPLRPNTTYSINFGNAIKDLHEGNIFNGYVFNFSTGESIDSLSLQGKVISASELTPKEGFFVGLYSDDNDTLTLDSLPYLVKPNYITTTDKKGAFEFHGLADKEYLIFALNDNNSNLIFDLPNEEIAFYPEMVRPYYIEPQIVIETKTTDTLVLDSIANDSVSHEIILDTISKIDSVLEIKKLEYPNFEVFSFIQEDSIQKIFKKELVEEGLLRFIFRYPADNVSITAIEELPDTFHILPVYSTRKDTVLWYHTPCKDSLLISIIDGVNISDTTRYSLKPRTSMSKRKRKQEENSVKRLSVKNNIKGNKLKPEQPLILTFNDPIMRVNQPDSLFFIENKDTIYRNLTFEKVDDYGFKYQIITDINPDVKYQLIIPDSVFFGIRNMTNDSIRLSFGVQEESALGNIFLTVVVPDDVPKIILELTTEQGKVVERRILTHTDEVAFWYIDPGKYKLKAILDLDANGVWSPGNFNKRLQPEKIIFYKGTLEVRANWDIDLDEPWIIEK